MSRRDAVRWLALRAAVVAAAALGVTGAAVLAPWERSSLDGGSRPTPKQHPQAAGPRTSPAAGGLLRHAGVQIFRSRPDLQPPTITVHIPSQPTADPGLVVTDCHFGPAQQGPLLIDGSGELVWFLPLSAHDSSELRAFNVRVQSYRGEPVLTWFEGAVVNGHGVGRYVLCDSRYRRIAEVSAQGGYWGDLHEFVLTDRGTALFTCYGQASADLSPFGGRSKGDYYYGVVQEVDVATGRLLFEWRSDEHVPLAESYERVKRSRAPWDYFHVNSICVDPTDDNLIVSGRNTWAFYKVERSSGKVLWRLGGKASDFRLDPNARFAWQHDVERWPDGTVTIFDNEAGPPAEASQSRGLVLSLDERARTASLVTQYRHGPPVLSDALGSVQDLPHGHRFMGWGTSTYFTEYDDTGRVLLDARLAPGTESYRAFKQPWRGQPLEPPAMAAERHAAGATVFASWNGATEVDHWIVLGGADPGHLRPIASARRTGFETAIAIARPPSHLAVEAVDRAGASLGRSSPQAVRA